MAELVSPRAARLAAPRWLDARLVLGVLLVLASIVAGARVFAAADHRSAVFVAAHDLVPGQHLTAADVAVGRVALSDEGSRYLSAAGAAPVGYVVTRYVAAGELVPAAALAGTQAATQTRLVTVPVEPGHLADELQRGTLVDVYVTPRAAPGAAAAQPELVVSAVPVEARDGGSRGFGATSSLGVVLAVPVARVPAVVRAVESGTVDLVGLPPAAAAGVRSASGVSP